VFICNLFKRKKLNQHEKDVVRFMRIVFSYELKDVHYFLVALTHKSFSNTKGSSDLNNERLEFLGDAVLDTVVAEYVYYKFPDESEGYLTKVKAKLVNRKTLSELGESMGIRKLLRFDNSRPINLETLQGNALEALVGAIYLDGGYQKAKSCLRDSIFPRFLDINKVLEEEIDFKSKLMIWAQKNKIQIEFTVLESKGNGNETLHLVEIRIKDRAYGRGRAGAKKAAEQLAAKETLILIGEIE
jgi:ribonuclease-3